MRGVALIGLALVFVVGVGRSAVGQTAADHNAAKWYQLAIDQYQALRENSPREFELLGNYDETQPVTAELRAALAKVQPILEMTRRGTAEESCNFPLDRSQGIEMLLPHLGQLRGIARVMRADTMVRLGDGDAAGAAANVADLYRMSDHFSGDRIVISSLVGQAVFGLADRTAQYGLDRGVFGEAESKSLLQGLSRLDAHDPFDCLEAVAGEQELAVGWLTEKFASDGGGKGIAEFREMFGGNDATELALMGMDEKAFKGAVEEYDGLMNRMVEIFAMPDAEEAKAAMKEVEAGFETHAYGPLASMLMPALGRVLEMRSKAEKMLADRRATLGALASGKATANDLANAALWYVRGAEMVGKLDGAVLKGIREFAADTSAPMSKEVTAALVSQPVKEILDEFREGTKKHRCDFGFTRPEQPWQAYVGFIPPYAVGVHDAIRIIHADAVRLLRAGTAGENQWEAADRLAIAAVVSAHMGEDPMLVSSLISHCNFNKTINLAGTALANGMMDESAKPMLFDAVDRMSRKDPFGFIGAVIGTRGEIGKYLGAYAARAAGADEFGHREDVKIAQERVTEQIKTLNGDQLLYLLAVLQTTQQNAAPGAEPGAAAGAATSAPPDPSRLGDVISLADLEAVVREIPQIAPQLSRQDVSFFRDRAIPAIAASMNSKGWVGGANFVDHMRRARNDLRKAHTLLRPHAVEEEKPTESPGEKR